MMRSLGLLDRADQETISRYQHRRLQFLVRLAAARSSFYRAWFRDARLDPRSVRTVADLAQLPLLDRNHLVTGAEQFLVYPAALVADPLQWHHRSPYHLLPNAGIVGLRAQCPRAAVELVRSKNS
jgi:hypothetical protein